MWILYALLAALLAALVTVFARAGLPRVDAVLATTLRALLMAGILLAVATLSGRFQPSTLATVQGREWGWIFLSAVAGAGSWLCYFLALQKGPAGPVAALDRLSIVGVVILAALFLGEATGWKAILGSFLVVAGALLITW